MASICKDNNIRFLLVTADTTAYRPEVEKEYKSYDPTFNSNYFEDDLALYAKSINIDYLGLQRIFRNHYNSNKKPLHWGHWNYEGHKVVAKALSNKLEDLIYFDNK